MAKIKTQGTSFLAANFKTVAKKTSDYVGAHRLEKYHELLCGYRDIFTKNVFQTKDHTYHNLNNLIQEKNVVAMKGKKDLLVAIEKLAWKAWKLG